MRLFHQEKDTLHDDVKEIFSNISLARKRSLQSAYMFIRSSYDDLTANELSDIYRELRTYPDDQIEPFLRGMKGSKKQAAQELIQKVF